MSTGRLPLDRKKAQRATTSEPSLPRRGRVPEERSAALHSLLERHAATQAGIVVTAQGTVDRSHYSRHFGVCESALAATCGAVLGLWNARLRDESNHLSPLGAEFVTLIEKELSENGRLVLKGNRINVTHYARALRASACGIRAAAGPRIAAYESEIQRQLNGAPAIKASAEAKAPSPHALKLEALLESDAASRRGIVATHGSNVDRDHYAAVLKVHKRTLLRTCREPLERWDAYLKRDQDGLSPLGRRFVAMIENDLASSSPIALFRQRINITHYARRLGATPRGVMVAAGDRLAALEMQILGRRDIDHDGAESSAAARNGGVAGRADETGLSPNQKSAPRPTIGVRFLERVARDRISDGGVATGSGRTIDLRHYAAELGVSTAGIRAALGPELQKLQRELRDEGQLVRSKTRPSAEDTQGDPSSTSHTPRATIGVRFRKQIATDRAEGKVATGERGSIDLRHYASDLGVTTAGIRAALGPELQELQQQLRDEGQLVPATKKRLAELIQQDVERYGSPIIGRGGTLDRVHYAALMGLNRQGFTANYRSELLPYDRLYGARTKNEARLPVMRQWLEDKFRERALTLRDGKIDRGEFQRHFGLKGGTFLTRNPGIRSLFNEFDVRVSTESYLPELSDQPLELLERALANPPLNKDLLTVNRRILSDETGLNSHQLKCRPYLELIEKTEKKLYQFHLQDNISPLLCGRVFQFEPLVEGWGREFLERFGSKFKKAYSGFSDRGQIKAQYLSIYDMFFWIGSSNLDSCRSVINDARSGGVIGADSWDKAVVAYRDHLVDFVKNSLFTKSNANSKIANIRRALGRIEPVLPKLQRTLPGLKFAKQLSSHIRSLAEVVETPGTGAKLDEYLSFSAAMLKQASDRFQVDLEDEESRRFIANLEAEFRSQEDLPENPAAAVLMVLNRRLESLKSAAEIIFSEAENKLKDGAKLRLESDIDAVEFYRIYTDKSIDRVSIARYVRQYFPKLNNNRSDDYDYQAWRRSVGNLIRLADEFFEGLLPSVGNEKNAKLFGQFFQKRYLELGGFEYLTAHFDPSRDACGAALTLYLLESGSNVAVGRTLFEEPVERSDQPGYKLITGHKARAKGKPIYAELPDRSAAIRAVEWYGEKAARYRSMAHGGDRECLFVHRVGDRCQLATPHWYTGWFKAFARERGGMLVGVATPVMLRPSVLLKAALENDGRLQMGRAIGQHGSAVTRGYQEKLPVRLLKDEHMRRFLRHYETRVLQNVEDVVQKLGISLEDFKARLRDLRATGLGTFCLNHLGRPGSEGIPCKAVDCWRDCPQLLIVAEVEAIALLQIWQASLRDVQCDWEQDHPERWEEVWLPWLCLTDVVEEKMSRGVHLRVWLAAKRHAAELRARPNFIPPRPF